MFAHNTNTKGNALRMADKTFSFMGLTLSF